MKVCIIGGGGGATNAANVIRSLDKQAKIDIFTNREEIGNLPCEIPFVLNGTLPAWESSFAFKEKFYKERNIEVHLNTEVNQIDRRKKVITAGENEYQYDKAILDLGALPALPDIPGSDGSNEFFLTTWLKHAMAFGRAIPNFKTAAIIGVGQIALEVAEVLIIKGYQKVYLIGRSDHILRAYLDAEMAEMVEKRIKEKGIELILSAKPLKLETQAGKKLLSLPDQKIEVDFLFYGAGAVPNTKLAEIAGIRLGVTGAIEVNEFLQTSDADIYAIGDCMENWERITNTKVRYQTATNAARTGRIAGRNLILGNVIRYAGTVMPFVMEAFGYQVGTIGFTEAEAIRRGLDVISSRTSTSTRRRMFGGKPIDIKLIADRRNKTLVGAQIVGEELVAGKIDKLAVAIAEKIPVSSLSLIDTCYSPTVGAGYEALTMALDELEAKFS